MHIQSVSVLACKLHVYVQYRCPCIRNCMCMYRQWMYAPSNYTVIVRAGENTGVRTTTIVRASESTRVSTISNCFCLPNYTRTLWCTSSYILPAVIPTKTGSVYRKRYAQVYTSSMMLVCTRKKKAKTWLWSWALAPQRRI